MDVADDLGLQLNHSKTENVCSNSSTVSTLQSVLPGFRWVEPSEACLLGSPIGDLNPKVLHSKHAILKTMGERLSLLHSHDVLLLLRNAFSLPKVLYILHTAPCFNSNILLDLDNLQSL